ncbi:heparan-alpha-glucosaminide N-acetyltransferase [Palleronia rufa]
MWSNMSDRPHGRAADRAAPAVSGAAIPRLDIVDVVRGLAIAGVVLFHIVWDLSFLAVIPPWVASHPLWLLFGRLLAGTFMALVGVSLVLAAAGGLRRKAFVRRLGILVIAALAITVVTRVAFPQTFVYFGILHSIAVASVIGVVVLRLPAPVIAVLGLAVYGLGFVWTSEAFDPRWLAWTGFAASPPPSNDLVPVFPWAGLTLLGMAGTRLAIARGWVHRARPLTGGLARSLAWMGRYSLPIYLIHQPVLLGVLIPLVQLVR